MKTLATPIALVATLCIASLAFAQEMPGFPQPTEQHRWLAKFAGAWVVVSECTVAPGEPTTTTKGAIIAKSLGGFWMVLEYDMSTEPLAMHGLQTLGYDAEKKKYVGTWVDSMTGHLWQYQGEVDQTGKKLTLSAEGPNMMQPGTMANYRDIYEFKSDDKFVMTSQAQTPEGEWVTFMTGTAKRKP